MHNIYLVGEPYSFSVAVLFKHDLSTKIKILFHFPTEADGSILSAGNYLKAEADIGQLEHCLTTDLLLPIQ